MAFIKITLCLSLLVALAACFPEHQHAESYASFNLLGHAEPSHHGHEEHHEHHVEHHHHPKYEFKYGVEDKHTGDYKDQKEERDGDVVKGEYSLLQPDGRKRIVHYTASKHGGFHALVSYSGHAIHPQIHHHHSEHHGHGL